MNRQQHRGNPNRQHHDVPERDDRGRFTGEHENVSRDGDRDINGYSRNRGGGNYDDYDQRDGRGASHRRGPNYGFGSDEEEPRRSQRSSGNESGGQERPRDENGRFTSEDDAGGRSSGDGQRGSLGWNQHSKSGRNTQRGPHSGKGPKGYRRSDERVEEEVNQALSDDDQLDASSIEVKVSGGDVTLTGTVSSREDKRRAEDCIDSISGVNNVENRIKVDRNSDSSSRDDSRQDDSSGKQDDSDRAKNKQASHANA